MTNDYLKDLVNFERESVKRILTEGKLLTIEYILPGELPLTNREILQVTIVLSIEGKSIHTKMDRIFIHQIGKRIYGDSYGNDYLSIFQRWHKDFNESNSNFKQKIIDTIIKNNLIIKYYFKHNKNIFYGFISPKFEDTDQLNFRKHFHKYANRTNNIKTDSYSQYKVESRTNPTVKEYYILDTGNTSVRLSCGIVYGINNGYGAYSTHWLRKFTESDIWLAPWKSDIEFKWRNNPRFHDDTANEEMERFVEFIVNEGTKHSLFIENKITTAQTIDLQNDKIKGFYELLRVAKATEDRIDTILKNKILEKGNTLMTYVESICHIGTFDKYTAKSVKKLLIETGTRLLVDEGFDIILNDNKEIVLTGNYEWY